MIPQPAFGFVIPSFRRQTDQSIRLRRVDFDAFSGAIMLREVERGKHRTGVSLFLEKRDHPGVDSDQCLLVSGIRRGAGSGQCGEIFGALAGEGGWIDRYDNHGCGAWRDVRHLRWGMVSYGIARVAHPNRSDMLRRRWLRGLRRVLSRIAPDQQGTADEHAGSQLPDAGTKPTPIQTRDHKWYIT